MLSIRSSEPRSSVCWISIGTFDVPAASAPRRSDVRMRPPSSTTVTPSGWRPSTLAATRCTMPSICAADSVRPWISFTTTDADGRRSSATNRERSGSARWTRADSTPPS